MNRKNRSIAIGKLSGDPSVGLAWVDEERMAIKASGPRIRLRSMERLAQAARSAGGTKRVRFERGKL